MSRRPPFSLYSGATRPDPVVLATPRTRCKRAAAHSPLCLISTSTPSRRAGLDPDSRLKMGLNATLALLPLGKQRLGAKAPLGMTYKMQPELLSRRHDGVCRRSCWAGWIRRVVFFFPSLVRSRFISSSVPWTRPSSLLATTTSTTTRHHESEI